MKKNNIRKNKIKNSQQGFSLIEMLVALAVFTMIIGGITLFSVRTIQAHTRSQAMQIAIENAQFAMEGLNKRIRASSKIKYDTDEWSAGNKKLFIIDSVDSTKYCYNFNNNKLTVKSDSTGIDDCNGTDLVGNGSDIKVSGAFYVKETDETGLKKRGLVTTVIKVEYNQGAADPFNKDSITIQSTVSLRDYGMNN